MKIDRKTGEVKGPLKSSPASSCSAIILGEEVTPFLSESGHWRVMASYEKSNKGVWIELSVDAYGKTPEEALEDAKQKESKILLALRLDFPMQNV